MRVRFTIEWKGNWEFFSDTIEMSVIPCIGDLISAEDFFKDYMRLQYRKKYNLEPFLLVYERVFYKDLIDINLRDPYSKEAFTPTLQNIAKWERMNREARSRDQERKEMKTVVINNSLLLKIRGMFGVQTFNQFPADTRNIYTEVSKCFPGSQVYACGSRVRGDYVDETSLFGTREHVAESQVILARKEAGMKARANSDYDFWVEPGATQVGDLPSNTDRCRLRIPESEKVPIPIYQV